MTFMFAPQGNADQAACIDTNRQGEGLNYSSHSLHTQQRVMDWNCRWGHSG